MKSIKAIYYSPQIYLISKPFQSWNPLLKKNRSTLTLKVLNLLANQEGRKTLKPKKIN
jgi:hypothetical protein